MYCEKCGNELKEGEKFCAKCGASFEQEETRKENTTENTVERAKDYIEKNVKNNQSMQLVKLILYILAIVIVIMAFSGAGAIGEASEDMLVLRSVGGETVAEAYYQYYGRFLQGLSTMVRALGLTCGIIVGYIGRKIK